MRLVQLLLASVVSVKKSKFTMIQWYLNLKVLAIIEAN